MFYQKKKMLNGRTISVILILVWLAYPLNQSNAHEGHDNFGGGNLGVVFEVPKETQFLLNVLTEQVGSGLFNASVLMYGTVVPSTSGSSIITAPITGKMSSLFVKVGDKVKKGQKLGVIAAFIDVNTQVAIEENKITVMQIEAERNSLQAELNAAQKENDRLQKIADIASKKEIDEAKSRLDKAIANLDLFNKNVGQGKIGNIDRFITLYAPISGTVNEFALTHGSTVNIGQELFKISNIDKVYIEGQIYDKDIPKLSRTAKFEAQCVNADHKANIRLVSNPQIINSENQSQKILFELENKDQDFKIGEFVNIRMFPTENSNRSIILPNSAITEINGKSIVFIKSSAEKYKLQYVNIGENNGTYTRIEKGIHGGERVVTHGTYQMKMIYLNQ
jgi:RND family efflux transporter MFP subunit